ncbi:GNAT family N-acetyltransferase [Candidatus Woesearchaeota archaeon]|jgi:predicted GNAT family acetyltransferase|nr:GNAT family N-acetyltransferase [Candidatus Woesearchaeota archaeon]MBT4387952.1 GNAT family N-acetyltransferase [Candidatus Woesearchaeota archaeon]MBT4595770.1 GNAT family N-acetyltransferase [Candidatus Woesearchaeota archaeon]MBT5741381.1 GNAT family N-acetyltransferase [Candidatus Woesearchaeota archaeon]MBT6505203.1 GNAT family N-acetyltransferase [Candidatus Woesearchaeota archaeon]
MDFHVQINNEKFRVIEQESNQGYNLILAKDDLIVGSATLEYYPNIDSLYFNRLFVQDEFRGQGLASEILKRVINYSKKTQKKIHNELNPYGDLDLEQLTKFYTDHGFIEIKKGLLYFIP